jgi:hypothetical protein
MSIVGYNPLPPMDEITVAVVETARLAADQWDRPPRLYALARRADLSSLELRMSPRARKAAPSALIPIAQDSLPEGDPMQVLARIRWPPSVPGCVLVTEVRIVPSDDRQQEEQARLSVGVLRNGRKVSYTCCLQKRGSDELTIGTDLADDVVTALLGTLASSGSAS